MKLITLSLLLPFFAQGQVLQAKKTPRIGVRASIGYSSDNYAIGEFSIAKRIGKNFIISPFALKSNTNLENNSYPRIIESRIGYYILGTEAYIGSAYHFASETGKPDKTDGGWKLAYGLTKDFGRIGFSSIEMSGRLFSATIGVGLFR